MDINKNNILSPITTNTPNINTWLDKYYFEHPIGSIIYVKNKTVYEKKDKWIDTGLTVDKFIEVIQAKDKDLIDKLTGGIL